MRWWCGPSKGGNSAAAPFSATSMLNEGSSISGGFSDSGRRRDGLWHEGYGHERLGRNFEIPAQRGNRAGRFRQWRSKMMDKSELEYLRRFAATFRNRGGFGAMFVKLDGNTGEWKKGKQPFNRQIIADVPDAMHGCQAFENNKAFYHIGRIADGFEPPRPESLGEHWRPVVLMPMYDVETHEPYMFTSQNKGGRDAIACKRIVAPLRKRGFAGCY
jgi:hypothetical protein